MQKIANIRFPMILLAIVLFAPPAGGADALTFQTVALSGQAAPGTGGRVFSFFYPPTISDSGRVAFASWLTGVTSNDECLMSGLPGSLQLVAREGSAAPGTTGVFTQNGWLFPRVNSGGVVAFSAALTGFGIDSTNNTGIWVGLPGSIAVAARAGNPAPGTPAGVVFSGGMQNWLMLNDAGQIVFRANLAGPGVDTTNDAGIWAGVPGALQLIAREGDIAPGTGGAVFDLFNYQFEAYPAPVMNAAGEVAFSGHCTGARGIWRWSGGALELMALTGTTAPGTGVFFEYLLDPWMNASGNVAFKATLAGEGVDFTNNAGIWAGVPGAVELVVRKGSAAPGANGNYLVLNSDRAFIDDGGLVTFVSSTWDGVSVNGPDGTWQYGSPGARSWAGTELVLEGTPAPGLSGVDFSSFWMFGPHPASSSPIRAYLYGTGVDGGNDDSFWLLDTGSQPQLIVREGDPFDIGGGTMRTIGSTIHTSINAGEGPCYTSNRKMAIGLQFVGGTAGIFAANVPVPTSPGDMNCDGRVDGLDVDGFALAVLNSTGYSAEFAGCNILNGDINQDSATNTLDTELMVDCILNGGCP